MEKRWVHQNNSCIYDLHFYAYKIQQTELENTVRKADIYQTIIWLDCHRFPSNKTKWYLSTFDHLMNHHQQTIDCSNTNNKAAYYCSVQYLLSNIVSSKSTKPPAFVSGGICGEMCTTGLSPLKPNYTISLLEKQISMTNRKLICHRSARTLLCGIPSNFAEKIVELMGNSLF